MIILVHPGEHPAYGLRRLGKAGIGFREEEKSILRFSDSGIGIPAEDMEHLFTAFHRGSNRNYAVGNGIGMALVQKIVFLHKGNIYVHSYPGEGTVFVVEFPHI